MSVLLISNLISLLLALAFVGLAVLHILGPHVLRNNYELWGYGSGLRIVLGVLLFASALFLAVPLTRVWGGLLAGVITFAAVATLLHRRLYALAVPGVLILGVLPIAMASGTLR